MRTPAIVLALVLAACAALPPPVTVDDALRMSKAGQSPDAIIAQMRASRSSYRLSASDIVRLHKDGLPEPVLDYMQQTQLEDVRNEQFSRDMVMGPPYPSPWWRRW